MIHESIYKDSFRKDKKSAYKLFKMFPFGYLRKTLLFIDYYRYNRSQCLIAITVLHFPHYPITLSIISQLLCRYV